MICVEQEIDIRVALDGLTVREQEILVAYYWHGKTEREIAVCIGISHQAVCKCRKVAEKKVRELVAKTSTRNDYIYEGEIRGNSRKFADEDLTRGNRPKKFTNLVAKTSSRNAYICEGRKRDRC